MFRYGIVLSLLISLGQPRTSLQEDVPEYANSGKSSVLRDFSIRALRVSEHPTQDFLVWLKEAFASLPWNVQYNLNQMLVHFKSVLTTWNQDTSSITRRRIPHPTATTIENAKTLKSTRPIQSRHTPFF